MKSTSDKFEELLRGLYYVVASVNMWGRAIVEMSLDLCLLQGCDMSLSFVRGCFTSLQLWCFINYFCCVCYYCISLPEKVWKKNWKCYSKKCYGTRKKSRAYASVSRNDNNNKKFLIKRKYEFVYKTQNYDANSGQLIAVFEPMKLSYYIP